MRNVLPERRHVNGHDLIEGAIAEAHRHMLDQIGHGIGERLSVPPNMCWVGRPMCGEATCPTVWNRPAPAPVSRRAEPAFQS